MPNNDDQLQQQYQDILNKYASSITPPVEPEPKPEFEPEITPIKEESTIIPPLLSEPQPESQPEIPAEPGPEISPELMLQSVPEPVTETPVEPTPETTIEPEPPVKEVIVPPIYFPPTPEEDKPSNFFKYLFYFSVIIFIGVVSALAYNFTNTQNTDIQNQDTIPTPTVEPTSFCEVGDKKYQVNESFPSEDGCNTCSCSDDLTVACTEMACVSPTSVQSTPSAKPTIKATTGKVYKDIKYGYQFECPTTAKYLVEATSVNGNKIPYKQESCTTSTSSVIISVYDNSVVHNFGEISNQVSPDKKYIITFEGDDVNIISSFKFL